MDEMRADFYAGSPAAVFLAGAFQNPMHRHLPSWLALAGVAVLLPLCGMQAQLPGTADLSFDPGTVLLNSLGNFSNVNAVKLQPDGKILVATNDNENTGIVEIVKTRQEAKPKPAYGTPASNVCKFVRFNADGSLDTSFNVTIDGGYDIAAIALESDGKIIIGGDFYSVNGNACSNIAVLKTDGSFDATFNAGGAGADNSVSSIVVQADGKIVIGGFFANYNTTSSSCIIRLNPDGSVDTGFLSGSGFGEASVQALALESDGKIIVGGSFGSYNNSQSTLYDIVRLNTDGTLDSSFSADADIEQIYNLTLQSNGQIVISAYFNSLGRQAVVRLDATGAIDPTFTFTADDTYVRALVAQPDDKILVGGDFYFVNSVPRAAIARLNADGSLDTTFDPSVGANGEVQQIELRPDGEIFVAGAFNGISNASRAQLALLYGVNKPGTVAFSASSYNVNEAGGSVQLMVQRTGGNTGAISVSYATADGTALAGTDYTPASGTLNWADGDVAPKSLTVPILNPLVYGGSKNFSVSLGSPTAGVTLGVAQAQVLILDSDPAPQPGVTLTSPPVDGLSFVTGSTVPLTADVSDPGSILSNVQFTVNGGAAGATITGTGPYVTSITAGPPGAYTVTAIATDTQGRTTSSSHVITVTDNSNPPPTITLLSDIGGRKFGQGATVPISIDATSADGSPLDSVTFYADGVPFATLPGSAASAQPLHGPTRKDASVAPASGIFQASYLMPANSSKIINLLAIAVSKLGGSQSTPVSSVQGVSPSVDAAPLVALNNITSSTLVQVGQTLNIPATVTDPDGGSVPNAVSKTGRRTKDLTPNSSQIARMEYFINQLKVKDSAQTPFGFSFTPSASGQYIVDAIATDGSGVSAVSTPVTVTAIAPPAVSLSVIGSGKAVEGGAKGKVLFTRTGGDPTLPLNVTYKVGGTAVNGTDFNLLSGTILIPAGQTSVKLKITPIDDTIPHDPRVIRIKLRPPTDGSYSLGTAPTVKLQLIDND